jgi:hypothetical protein
MARRLLSVDKQCTACQQGQLALQHSWLFVMNGGRHDDSHGYPNIIPNQNTYMN